MVLFKFSLLNNIFRRTYNAGLAFMILPGERLPLDNQTAAHAIIHNANWRPAQSP
jgi:hypothetical protein